MNKKLTVTLIIMFFIFNIKVYGEDAFIIEKNIDEIINIENINILDKNKNKIGDRSYSSVVTLNNGNLLVGELKPNQTYDYYELNKQGKKTFITNSKYYIKDINAQTGSFTIVKKENNEYYLGVLDKEFNVIYDNIFEYKENAFTEYSDILKVKNKGYGVFTIDGNQIISPIFDNIKKIDNDKFECLYKNNIYILKNSNGVYINETALNKVDNWAKDSVKRAVDLGFISHNLQVKLNENITRAEFCEIIIKLYEEKTGFDISTTVKSPFVDTNNDYVLKAYTLGIVSGKANNKFEPNSYITREESAVILSNLMGKMEYHITELNYTYKDEKLISNWAKNSIQLVSNAKIMNGDTKGYFNPKNNYKVVEAISTIMRLYNLK